MNESEKARKFHESEAQCKKILRELRLGKPVRKMDKERYGNRIAPCIDLLRNYWGLGIDGHGTQADPYLLTDMAQLPTLIAVTDAMKGAYYNTEHWRQKREERLRKDSWQCVNCDAPAELVHHCVYNLFAELLSDLQSVCEYHHDMVHGFPAADRRLAKWRQGFPKGVTPDIARKLGHSGEFPAWLMEGIEVCS